MVDVTSKPLGKVIELPPALEAGETMITGEAHQSPTVLWRFIPGPEIQDEVPPKPFEIESFETKGQLRFTPSKGLLAFLPIAWATGLAILVKRNGLDAETVQRHRLAWYLTLKSWKLRPYLKRNFGAHKDLRLSPSARKSPEEDHLVPVVVDGRQWDLAELFRQGREEALRRGEDNAGVKRLVHLGLMRGAQLSPLEISGENVTALIRRALFDPETARPDVSEELVGQVWDRFCEAFEKHLDDTTDEFNKWWLDAHDGIVNQFAKKKTAPGGMLDRNDVTAALAEIGFRSFGAVAECVEAAMNEFASLLPRPLTAYERQLYEAIYYRQPWLGGLSLALVFDRMHFLREALLAVWEQPSDVRRIRVLHRMLDYYAAMSTEAREADRRRKSSKELSLNNFEPESSTNPTRARGGSGHRLDEDQVKKLGLQCDCLDPQWYLYAEGSRGSRGRCECHGCGTIREVNRPRRPK